MLISIITVVKNNVSTIERCVSSVLSQTKVNLEYIVIDGYSDDGTWEKLKGLKKLNNEIVLIRYADKGIYDALNKGYEIASGDFVGILNSDDFYCRKTYLNDIFSMPQKGVDIIQTDCYTVPYNNINKKLYFKAIKPTKFILKLTGSLLNNPHTSLFFSNQVYKSELRYSVDFASSADFIYLYDVLSNNTLTAKYIPISGICFSRGLSNTSDSDIASRENKYIYAKIGSKSIYRLFGKGIFLVRNYRRVWVKLL